ncbi:hypothetical protein ABFS83_06G025600 [Erythranthe nasuta]
MPKRFAIAPANLPPSHFSKTQRLVLLIDLHPLLTLQNPSSYISAVTSAADRLLRFPPLSASLSAFKLFFSSLSPLRTAAVLTRQLSTSSLSFNLFSQTLDSLSTTLNSISTIADLPNSSSRASYTASSLLQLIHDYAWDTGNDNLLGEDDSIDGRFTKIPSNLVILLSPISQSINCLADYLDLRELDEVFSVVKEAFVIRDIHLCWVDVKSDELDIQGAEEKKDGSGDELVKLRDGIGKMGWGFCSSNFIVLGSAIMPLALIYPKIGLPFDFLDFGGFDKIKYNGELNLEILGVNAMPLECKFCDLEFVSLNSLPASIDTDDIFNSDESRNSQSLHNEDKLWGRLGKGNMKLHVKSVHTYEGYEKSIGSSETVLVRECFQEIEKNKKKKGDDFFADRVLQILHDEMGGVSSRNQIPTWQMFLSFLHMKGYCALVSISNGNGDTFMCSLKPFSSHLAILSICDPCDVSPRDKSCSQTDTSTSDNCEQYENGKRKKNQRHLYKGMTWSSFCKAAFGGSNFDLFELYAAKYFEKSKKLKFLKCWMKQICKGDISFLTTLPGSKSVDESSACNALLSEPSPAKEGAPPVLNSQTSESFFKNLSKKIEHGLESGMDLQNLAEGVVKSCIHWLHDKCKNENSSEGQHSMRNSDDCSEAVGGKLIELLLKSPKEMKKIHQDSDPSSSSENIVREYELQIFLRLEILRSDVSTVMGESRKKKLLKQICSLLEIIQYLVAGGIHGHISLYDYVECTIKARYSGKLEEVVEKIYSEMDLLPFGDEGESPSILFNSEDSNQSWRDKQHDINEKAEANYTNQSVSTEGDSSQPLANACQSIQEENEKDAYTRILNKALERRERARKFSSFVSNARARDLQRVWAPKQPKVMNSKFDPLLNKSKKKDKRTPGFSVVCETPMTGNKRAHNDVGNTSYSVYKSLFQDN